MLSDKNLGIMCDVEGLLVGGRSVKESPLPPFSTARHHSLGVVPSFLQPPQKNEHTFSFLFSSQTHVLYV